MRSVRTLMTGRTPWIALLFAACGGAAAPVSAPPPTASPSPPACVELPDDADAPQGELVLSRGYSEVRIYRVSPGCTTLVDTVDPGGTVAFAFLGEAPQGGMPDLSIETSLMHGDRLHKRFTWSGDHYSETGRAEEIPGRRR